MSEIKKLIEEIEKEIEEAETVNRSVYKQIKLEGVKEGIKAIKKDVEELGDWYVNDCCLDFKERINKILNSALECQK